MKIKNAKDMDSTSIKLSATVYGKAGTGKTTLGATFPKPFFLDLNKGLLSIRGKDVDYVELYDSTWVEIQDTLDEAIKSPDHESIIIDSMGEVAEICMKHICQLNRRQKPEFADWDAFYQFYTDTGSRKWGEPYLNRRFFSLITESMAERILLVMCKREGRYVAGALNLIGEEALFGRYWGCIEDHPFLHFEVCYYQAIDYAIQHGLARVEAGAQGPHKIARGYRPTETHSSHYIRDPSFREAVANYLEHERAEVIDNIEYLAERGPFRKGERQSLD